MSVNFTSSNHNNNISAINVTGCQNCNICDNGMRIASNIPDQKENQQQHQNNINPPFYGQQTQSQNQTNNQHLPIRSLPIYRQQSPQTSTPPIHFSDSNGNKNIEGTQNSNNKQYFYNISNYYYTLEDDNGFDPNQCNHSIKKENGTNENDHVTYIYNYNITNNYYNKSDSNQNKQIPILYQLLVFILIVLTSKSFIHYLEGNKHYHETTNYHHHPFALNNTDSKMSEITEMPSISGKLLDDLMRQIIAITMKEYPSYDLTKTTKFNVNQSNKDNTDKNDNQSFGTPIIMKMNYDFQDQVYIAVALGKYQLFMISHGAKDDNQYMMLLIEKDVVAFKESQAFIISQDKSKLCKAWENASILNDKQYGIIICNTCINLRKLDNVNVSEINNRYKRYFL